MNILFRVGGVLLVFFTLVNQATAEDWQRTVVYIYGQTVVGQDMLIRGGIDHSYAFSNLGKNCTKENKECAIPIRHRLFVSDSARSADHFLDWYGAEEGQVVEGSPLSWTTNNWPAEWGAVPTIEKNGYGLDSENVWGMHFWKLDVDMDCSKTMNGWFELKSFISNGPGWESNVSQVGAPYSSINHFAQCGKLNVFKRGESTVVAMQSFSQSGSFAHTFNTLYLRTASGWGTLQTMTLIADHVWQGETSTWRSSANQFKFDVNGDWSLNFGDNPSPDGIGDRNGANIYVDGCYNFDCTAVKVRFNDETHEYAKCYNSQYHNDSGSTRLCSL